MAKMMPKNSTIVSVRHTPRFSLSRHGLLHLVSALSHSRSSAFSSRFSTKAMQMPMSSGDSSDPMLFSTPPSSDRLFKPQYSSVAKAMSSMTRLMVLLFSSNPYPALLVGSQSILSHHAPHFHAENRKFFVNTSPCTLFSFNSERKEEKKRRQKLRFWISLHGFTCCLSYLSLPREHSAA